MVRGKKLIDWCKENENLGQNIYLGFFNCIDDNNKLGIKFEDLFYKSNKKVYFRCDNPNHSKYFKRVADVTRNGFYCNECSLIHKSEKLSEKSKGEKKNNLIKKSLLEWCNENGESGIEVYNYFMRCQDLNLNNGYSLENLSPGSNKLIDIICENGHKSKMFVYSLTSGRRCKKCYENNRGKIISKSRVKDGNNFYNWLLSQGDYGLTVIDAFNRCYNLNNGVKLDELAPNSNSNSFYLSCENELHKPWKTNTANVHSGKWCPLCRHKSSYPEQIIYFWCKKNFNSVLNRDKQICGVEADILVNDIKLVIEYNSSYYHNLRKDRSEFDRNKLEIYKSRGYHALVIEDTNEQDKIEGDKIYHNYLKDKNCYNLIKMISNYLLINGCNHLYTELDEEIICFARSSLNK